MEASQVKTGRKYAYQLRKRSGVMKLNEVRTAANGRAWYDGVDVDTKGPVSAALKQLSPAS